MAQIVNFTYITTNNNRRRDNIPKLEWLQEIITRSVAQCNRAPGLHFCDGRVCVRSSTHTDMCPVQNPCLYHSHIRRPVIRCLLLSTDSFIKAQNYRLPGRSECRDQWVLFSNFIGGRGRCLQVRVCDDKDGQSYFHWRLKSIYKSVLSCTIIWVTITTRH